MVVFAPAGAMGVREDVDFDDAGAGAARRRPDPPRRHRRHRGRGRATSCTTRSRSPTSWPDTISVEVFDPRTLYPFDWPALAASLERTGRLVVIDDSNRTCGIGGEILATAAEEMRLIAPPRRITRPDGAVLPFALDLDRAVQPSRDQLAAAVRAVMK